MPENVWLLLFSILVVVTVYLFREYVQAVVDLRALLVTILTCVIFAAIHVFIVGASAWGFIPALFFIYAGSNLIFQIVKQVSGLRNL